MPHLTEYEALQIERQRVAARKSGRRIEFSPERADWIMGRAIGLIGLAIIIARMTGKL